MVERPANLTQNTTPADVMAVDLSPLDQVLRNYDRNTISVVSILQRTQDAYGYLPRQVLHALSQRTGIPLAQLYGVATFYAQFHLCRRGKHLLRVCDGTACHVRGATKNIEAVEQKIGLAPGATTPDYRFTMEIVYCLGSCGLSPVAVLDDKVLGRLNADTLVKKLQAVPR